MIWWWSKSESGEQDQVPVAPTGIPCIFSISGLGVDGAQEKEDPPPVDGT